MAFHYALLEKRVAFAVRGKDRFDYLQGILTQDIAPCRYGNVVYGLMLQAQGKFLCEAFVVPDEETLWLDSSGAYADSVAAKLGLYKLGRDVSVERAFAKFYVCWGDNLPKAEGRALVYDDVRHGADFRRILAPEGITAPLKGGEKANFSAYRRRRIMAGLPDGDEDLAFNASYPLDFCMDGVGAFSFTKGCYIGQEVTARMYYKGKRKKAPFTLLADGGEIFPVDGGDVCLPSGQKIGAVTSSEGDAAMALALDRALLKQGEKVSVGGVGASIAGIAREAGA